MLNLWIDLWHHEGTTPSVSFIQSWCIKIFLVTLNNLSFTLYPSLSFVFTPPEGGVPGLCVQPSKAAWAPFALLRDREGGLGDRVAAQWSWVSLCHWGLWIGSLFLSSWSAVGSFVWLSELPGWDQNVLSGLCWVLLGPWALASLACYWLNTRVHFQLGLRCKLQSCGHSVCWCSGPSGPDRSGGVLTACCFSVLAWETIRFWIHCGVFCPLWR